MTIRVDADFAKVVEKAGKAAVKVRGMYSEAAKAGLLDVPGFAGRLKKLQSLQNEYTAKKLAVELRHEVRRLRATKNHAQLELEFVKKIADAQADANAENDADKKENHLQEVKRLEKLRDVSNEFGTQLTGSSAAFVANLAEAEGSLKKISSLSKADLKRWDRVNKDAKEVGEWWKDNVMGGSAKWVENLSSGAEAAGEAFTNGVDVTALTKSISSGLGKAMAKAGEGLGSMGGAGVAAGAAVTAVAAVVAVLGVLLVAFIGMDKKVKEFNKDVIKTHGALSVASLGFGNLANGTATLKRAVMDLSGNFGVSEEDAKSLFDTLDNGGQTLKRLTSAARTDAEAQSELSRSIREIYVVANATGVSLSTYAENLTNYVNDLAMSTNTVNDSFASIAKMANESAFGTRRFYSMVVQATAGQASLNVHLEQTGDLLMRMSKIMGAKKAAELAGSAAGDMGAKSAQERIKATLLSGNQGKRRFGVEAQQQAATFARDTAGGTKQTKALTDALASAGLTPTGIGAAVAAGATDPNTLVQKLGKLNQREQARLIAELHSQGTEEADSTARRLEQLISLSRGARGGMSDMVNSMESFSAGGSIAYNLDSVQNVLGARLEDLNAKQRVAAESILGVSGHQYDAMRDLSRNLAGGFDAMSNASLTADSEQDKRFVKMYGATRRGNQIVAASIVNGRVQTGRVIENANDLAQTYVQATGDDATKVRDEMNQLGQQTMDATVSIADILENKIAIIMQRVYDVLNGPINHFLNLLVDRFGNSSKAAAIKTQADTANLISEKIDAGAASRSKRVRDISRLTTVAGSSTNSAERTDARAQLEILQRAKQADDAMVASLNQISVSVASGNTFYTRAQGVDRADNGKAQLDALLGRGASTQGIQINPNATPAAPAPAAAPSAATLTQNAAADAEIAANDAAYQALIHRRGAAAAVPAPTAAAAAAVPAPVAAAAVPAPAAPPEAREAIATAQTQHTEAQATATLHVKLTKKQMQEERQRAIADARFAASTAPGDALARSKLPEAIATADAKQRLLEILYKSGPAAQNPELMTKILSGTANEGEMSGLGDGAGIARTLGRQAHDFVYQDRGGRSVLTPIDREDQVVGMKPGGAIANATGRGGGGNVHITINGGDEARIFQVVRRAINQAGITPNRVTP